MNPSASANTALLSSTVDQIETSQFPSTSARMKQSTVTSTTTLLSSMITSSILSRRDIEQTPALTDIWSSKLLSSISGM